MKFSKYNPSNIEEIKILFTQTFSDSEGQSEGQLIGDLSYDLMTNTNDSDFYCFIATENEQITGCIIFSRLVFENGINAFLLGPVSVHTNYQRKGIGQNLMNFGLNTLKEEGVELAFTYGDPSYYSKVGFSHIAEELIKAPLTLKHPEGWLAKSLTSDKIEPITGNSCCVKALNKAEYW